MEMSCPLSRFEVRLHKTRAAPLPGLRRGVAQAFGARHLSVSYLKIGDVLVAQGNLPEALQSFRASHDIFDRLAQSDPGNAGWQRDLSVSYAKLADVSKKNGESRYRHRGTETPSAITKLIR
jgi:hypothetical protein